jgi:hypothetical protein
MSPHLGLAKIDPNQTWIPGAQRQGDELKNRTSWDIEGPWGSTQAVRGSEVWPNADAGHSRQYFFTLRCVHFLDILD